MAHRTFLFGTIFAAALAFAGLRDAVFAQSPPDRSRPMTIITSSPPGGGYDAYSRLLSRYMPRYLPGNPTIIVQNMPGGAGIRAANYLYNIAPKDGSTFALLDRAVGTAPLLYGEESKAQFEATKFNWIGSVMRENGMTVLASSAPVSTIEDARRREVIVGSTGPEQDTSMYPRLLNELLGTKFKVIFGYAGQPEIFQAVERGELQGLFMSGWSGNGRAYVRERMSRRQMKLLLQISSTGDPQHKDTPTIVEMVTRPEDREIVDLLLSRLSLGRPFMAPPGVPAERVAELRKAFRQAIEDPDLRAEAAQQRLAIDPIWGEEAQEIITRVYRADPALVKRTRDIVRVAQ
ncbi:MAG: tripartite tricarboxylate transporter substrate-binding protein [Beijerinckiaceae bacterium]|nr:tripartite tricarboxylate transporter substrate-binding protein [Beijerinckiaceae bacterium]